MRILYGTEQPFPHPRADTQQIVNTVAALARRGVAVELLIPNFGTPVNAAALREYYDVEGDFEVTQLPGALKSVHVAHKVEHSLRISFDRRAREADLVYTRSLGTVAACLARGYRVALDAYRPWPKQYPVLAPPLRAMVRHDNFLGILLHSDFARRAYLDADFPANKLQVARNGHEPRRFEPRLDIVSARRQIGIPEKGEVVVYAGRINAQKGLELVLEMARMRPEILFLLVGSQDEGPIEAAAAGIDNVRILPHQTSTELPAFLYAADVLIIPPSSAPLQRFRNTVLPIKLFTYLAAGRVILAPRAPDTAELLAHDQNALLVTPGDARRAADELRALLDDEPRRRRLQAGALALGQSLTWDSRAEIVESFLSNRLQATSGLRRAG